MEISYYAYGKVYIEDIENCISYEPLIKQNIDVYNEYKYMLSRYFYHYEIDSIKLTKVVIEDITINKYLGQYKNYTVAIVYQKGTGIGTGVGNYNCEGVLFPISKKKIVVFEMNYEIDP